MFGDNLHMTTQSQFRNEFFDHNDIPIPDNLSRMDIDDTDENTNPIDLDDNDEKLSNRNKKVTMQEESKKSCKVLETL